MNASFENELIEQATSKIASLAFVFPLTPGKAEERRSWGRADPSTRRSAIVWVSPSNASTSNRRRKGM